MLFAGPCTPALSAGHIAGMNTLFAETPLKEMDPSALSQAIMHKAEEAGMNLARVAEAIDAATYLHLGQTRANRGPFSRTPYIEHPLRGSLRALRWGVTAEHIILAILLHDVVEDCLERLLARFVPGDHAHLDINGRRSLAYGWIASRFDTGTARIVKALTNPPAGTGEKTRAEKNADYRLHVKVEITDDAEVFIGKLIDFDDNAGGLHHNAVPGNEKMVGRLAVKYGPVADVFAVEFIRNLAAIAALVSEDGLATITRKMTGIKARLTGLEARYA